MARREADPSSLAVEASREFYQTVDRVADWPPPGHLKEMREKLTSALFPEVLPPYLARLAPTDKAPRNWLDELRKAILDSVMDGLEASHYHAARIVQMERAIYQAASTLPVRLPVPPGQGVSSGNHRALHYEYQALLFACRRTLEYLAVAIGCFFRRDVHRLKGVSKAIANSEPSEVAARVLATVQGAYESLPDILSDNEERTSRDTLAHWRAVRSGSFLVTWVPKGVRVLFLGGGEELSLDDDPLEQTTDEPTLIGAPRLTPILDDRMARLKRFIADVLTPLGILS